MQWSNELQPVDEAQQSILESNSLTTWSPQGHVHFRQFTVKGYI